MITLPPTLKPAYPHFPYPSLFLSGPDAADKLLDIILGRSYVGHLAVYSLWHQLQLVLYVLLEIAIGRAARHRAHRTHAAIGFIGAALVEECLARRFLGSGQQRPDHHAGCARRQRLGDIARGKIGRASGRERVGKYVEFWVGGVA